MQTTMSSAVGRRWRWTQWLLVLASAGLVAALVVAPTYGLHVLWNGLIPLAPLLLVVAPGLWRNLCPLGTVSLVDRLRAPVRRRAVLPGRLKDRLSLASVGLLWLIVPARHLWLDTDGPATALMLLLAGLAAVLTGTHFEGRGGWCTALCPVHPVEKLYGFAAAHTFENARCERCIGCARPCPDSEVEGRAPRDERPGARRWAEHLMAGGFVGFVWGWFQVPDLQGPVGVAQVATAYGWPLGGAVASWLLFWAVQRWPAQTPREARAWSQLFAAAAATVYAWYRVPALLGFGPFLETGLLVDLRAVVPGWTPLAARALTTGFFGWFLVLRVAPQRAWLQRPRSRGASTLVVPVEPRAGQHGLHLGGSLE